ncbi:hypothetical protein AB0L40_01780 [Patulibacter sp. NPDC049589]|uniref:hypothetical protein n=1 Tax=Patulibacter sp. NPDC049589 TaxID=3154731 RepID=UPI00342F937B
MRTLLTGLAALGATAVLAAGSSAADAPDGGGAQVGGSVLSTLSLDLTQTGSTVRVVSTSTEPGSGLSVTSFDGRSGLRAKVGGRYALLEPAFGLRLVTWDGIRSGQATTLHLKSGSSKPATVLVTLSAPTP